MLLKVSNIITTNKPLFTRSFLSNLVEILHSKTKNIISPPTQAFKGYSFPQKVVYSTYIHIHTSLRVRFVWVLEIGRCCVVEEARIIKINGSHFFEKIQYSKMLKCW